MQKSRGAIPARRFCSFLNGGSIMLFISLTGLRRERPQGKLITQGHIYVNGRKVDVGSFSVNVGDKITVKNSPKSSQKGKTAVGKQSQFYGSELAAA